MGLLTLFWPEKSIRTRKYREEGKPSRKLALAVESLHWVTLGRMGAMRSLLLLPCIMLSFPAATSCSTVPVEINMYHTSKSGILTGKTPTFCLLKRARGGAVGRSPGSGGSSGSVGLPSFPFFPPTTTTLTPPKSSSSSRSSASVAPAPGVWGFDHFDSRPVVLEPRVVENIKGRDSRVGLIRKVKLNFLLL